ncbi:regulatory signaling modulator protein AmpE [Natronospira bacteriovora]|uniref:Regulatory signaling modulator protein AmpE n=1 Tax=Natronospira bacteriovora TaxID=3069753 RepID=A0ABU0W9K6_9GAMM|nr:regulatory signaling modulator protein AmpE [Natronospira sp. AB-CW4]MDQ2070589.1 regulatory signaling modulator protein AmpE [Natronospira sp. AB-CW4]
MTFLAIIAALALERALHAADLEHFRRMQWFSAFRDQLLQPLASVPGGNGPLGVAAVCLLPTVMIWLAVWLLAQFSVVLAFALSVFVLLYCLGPGEILGQLKRYLDAHDPSADEGGDASRLAAEIMESEQGLSPEDDSHRAVTEAALVRANDRLFAVIFWFVLLGPAGAVLYRSADLLRRGITVPGEEARTGLAQHAVMFEGILAWLPARLLAISYALTGSFEEAMADWKAYYEECTEPFFETSEGVLSCAGCGALRISAGTTESGLAVVRSARGLLMRSLVLWLAVLAMLTLAGLT